MNEIFIPPVFFVILQIVTIANMFFGGLSFWFLSSRLKHNIPEVKKELLRMGLPRLRIYVFGSLILVFFFWIIGPLMGYRGLL